MIVVWYVLTMLIFAFIGSGINYIAIRMIYDQPRHFDSTCSCGSSLQWYNRFPFFSWIVRRRCRGCVVQPSILSPFTELCAIVIGVSLLSVFSLPFSFEYCLGLFVIYSFFSCALLAATRTDLEAMVIPQLFSLWLVPVGIVCAWFDRLFISWLESCVAALFGYGILWLLGLFFKKVRKKDGLGEGDMELLACIGSFLGIQGVVQTLLIGSVTGIIAACFYFYYTQQSKNTPVPFGPFLSLGAFLYLLQTIGNMGYFF